MRPMGIPKELKFYQAIMKSGLNILIFVCLLLFGSPVISQDKVIPTTEEISLSKNSVLKADFGKFYILKQGPRTFVVHLMLDPVHGNDGVIYASFMTLDKERKFTKLNQLNGERSPAKGVVSIIGKTREGKSDTGGYFMGKVPLGGNTFISFSKGGPSNGWLYINELNDKFRIYKYSFRNFSDIILSDDSDLWLSPTVNKNLPVLPEDVFLIPEQN